MRALIYTGPHRLELGTMPDPRAGEGEAVVRVAHCGICGSDMHAFAGHDERRPAPLVLGHEVAGRVEGGAHDGRRVTVNPLATCGRCPACRAGRTNLCPQRQIISMPPRQGGFAEAIAIPQANLVAVPDGVPLARAALAEPLACGWHGVKLGKAVLRSPVDDAPALVIGGGAIGLGAALALRAQGFAEIALIEPNEGRRARVEQAGFVTHASEATLSPGYGLIVDAVGYPATRAAASALAAPGGVIVHIGLGAREGGLDLRRMTLQEITVIGTYTYTAEDFRETAEAIFDGRLGPLDWIEQRPLEAGAAAFADIAAGRAAAPKIVLDVNP